MGEWVITSVFDFKDTFRGLPLLIVTDSVESRASLMTNLGNAARDRKTAMTILDVTTVERRQYPESIDIEWPRTLQWRTGLPRFTDGIDIYFDFDWLKEIEHPHAKFKNGKGLAQRARLECQDGKQPAILLTTRNDITADTYESATHRVVIVNVHKIRKAISATEFFASSTDVPLTELPSINKKLSSIRDFIRDHPQLAPQVEQIARQRGGSNSHNPASIQDAIRIIESLEQISDTDAAQLLTLLKYRAQDVEVLDGILDAILDAEAVIRWTGGNPNRRSELIEKLDDTGAVVRTLGDVIEFLRSNPVLQSGEIKQILHVLPEDDDAVLAYLRDNMPLIKQLAENEYTESDLQALRYRREQLDEFRRLLREKKYFASKQEEWSARGPEAVWQKFFQKNQWIWGYGLSYVFMTAVDPERLEQTTTGATFDQRGKRIDGLMKTTGELSHVCFVELKTHDTPLLKEVERHYRPKCWVINDDLTGGMIQVQQTIEDAVRKRTEKIELFDENGNPKGEEIFLHRPKGFLVVGNKNEFETENGTNVDKLGSFELFRRNIASPEVMTYDELYDRAKHIVVRQNAGPN